MAQAPQFIPRRPEAQHKLVKIICEDYGDRLGPWFSLFDHEDGLEELAFRILCGELGEPR